MKVIVAINPVKHVMEIGENGNHEFSLFGLEGRLLKIISDTLGFDLSFVSPPDGQWGGRNPNGTWNGLMGMLVRNEADLAMSFIAMDGLSHTVVDYSTSYLQESVKFMVGKPKAQSTAVALLKIFDVAVWIGVAFTLLLLPLIFRILLKESFGYTLLQCVGNLVKQPTTIRIMSKTYALLLGFWWFYALIISFSYSAAVLSFLSYPLDEKAIRTFQDLSEAVEKGTHRCLILRGSGLDSQLQWGLHAHLKYLGDMINKKSWFFDAGHLITEKEFSTTAIIDLQFMLKVNYGFLEMDSVLLSTDYLESGSTAISINKNFCCKRAINTVISRIQSSGIINKIMEDELISNWLLQNRSTYSKPKTSSVTLDNVRGPFIILFAGYIVATFSLISEKLYYSLF